MFHIHQTTTRPSCTLTRIITRIMVVRVFFFHLGHSQSQQTTNYQSVVEWVRNQDKDHDLLVDMEHDQLHSELLNHGLWLDCVVRSRLRGPDDHFHNQGYYNLVSTGARARARQSMTRTKNYKHNHSQSVNKRELIKTNRVKSICSGLCHFLLTIKRKIHWTKKQNKRHPLFFRLYHTSHFPRHHDQVSRRYCIAA